MIIFHAPDILTTGMLPPEESHHCAKVLRMRAGDRIEAIDGRGNRIRAIITDADHRGVSVDIEEVVASPLPWTYDITVAVAPTKNMDRMEWLVEKLTEVGVSRIIPMVCKRSVRREVKIERLVKIAVSAAKQSLKSVVPEIMPATPLPQVIKTLGDEAQRFVAYCSDDVAPRGLLSRLSRPDTDTAIMIGPEGDFTPDEVEALIAADWVPVSLGDTRLRTETAALAACTTLHIVNQIMSKN
ncbi:MAG: 16S rRNA (uracil(1498)-N(3))-methyltransferase [Paramuribaculum sp.]|nr:16S rRNA (uracil(1498)-N(3))-methyltransferase [Paramuribaculum sp.]